MPQQLQEAHDQPDYNACRKAKFPLSREVGACTQFTAQPALRPGMTTRWSFGCFLRIDVTLRWRPKLALGATGERLRSPVLFASQREIQKTLAAQSCRHWHPTPLRVFGRRSVRRATASESSPTQCLQYPKQQSSIIRGEEHCVPEAGMQWHILSGTSRSQGNILNGVECHPLFLRDKPQARFRHPSFAHHD